MNNTVSILSILLFAITSCKSLSEIGNNKFNTENITKDNFKKLNGVYTNSFDSSIGKVKHSPYDALSDIERLTISDQLFYHYPETAWRNKNGQRIDPTEKWIKLEFQSSRLATVSMYHNNDYIFSKKIRGKIQNGYFYVRPKNFVIPLIPFVFGYNFERARIGITAESLVIDYRVNRWGYALIAGSADKGFASSVYKKKK